MAKKRTRRVSLRGWWHALPFLVSAFAVFFGFAWLEAERLKNEYRASGITEEIWEVRASIRKLREQRHYLNRMERMERHAPSLELIEANPDQIILIEATAELVSTGDSLRADTHVAERRATRSVVFNFEVSPETSVPNTRDTVAEVTQLNTSQAGG